MPSCRGFDHKLDIWGYLGLKESSYLRFLNPFDTRAQVCLDNFGFLR